MVLRGNESGRTCPAPGRLASTAALGVTALGAIVAWLGSVIRDVTLDLTSPGVGTVGPDDVLVSTCATLAMVIALRWLIGLLLTVLALVPGAVGALARRGQRVLAPRALVRLTSAVLGGTVLAVLPAVGATAAHAGDVGVTSPTRGGGVTPGARSARGDEAAARLPDPGWRTARTATSGQATDRVDAGAVRRSVRVAAGDTLWDLAAQRLPAGSDAARIDRVWRAWYAANRRVVGPDPDLIRPGQRLVPPPALAHPDAGPQHPPEAGPAPHQRARMEESR